MSPLRLFLLTAAAFAALFVLRRVLQLVRPALSVDTMNDLKARGAVIVDVRTAGEFACGGVPGSLNIPLDHLTRRLGELPKDRPIIVCCASGSRSSFAKRFLEGHGFQEVYNAGPWQACR